MSNAKQTQIEIPGRLPAIPLRDVVIFPYMIFPLLIGRPSSVKAVEEAMLRDKLLFVVAQKDPQEDEPRRAGLYPVGTVVKVLQILKLPNNVVKVLVEGVTRARIKRYSLSAEVRFVDVLPLGGEDQKETPRLEALARVAANLFRRYVNLNPNLPDEILGSLEQMPHVSVLIDFIAAHVSQNVESKQPILEAEAIDERLQHVIQLLEGENEILELERTIENQVRDKISKHQRAYYLQEQLRVIREELGDQADDDEGVVSRYKEKLEKAKLPEDAHARVEEELDKLRQMTPASPEAHVIRTYVDWILSLPWNEKTKDNLDMSNAERILDEDHYGLAKPKERILEHLAVLRLVKKMRGQIICFVGPPGVGKTSLGRSIARALKRNFVRLSLGGVRDEAEIRGHRRTYIGALPGRIIQSMKKAGSRNPVILLDEIDKMSMDFRGDPSAALLEVLDPQQNNAFSDHYLDLDFDLSEVMFITTANVAGDIPPALRDRMELIYLPGYLLHEKLHIAQDFLVPRQLEEHGLDATRVTFDAAALEAIVMQYTQEAGVRTLERRIAKICRKVAREQVGAEDRRKLAKGRKSRKPTLVPVDPAALERYLGVAHVLERRAPLAPMLGKAVGLAWTPVGGDLLMIEVGLYPGRGRLVMTGKLGEVMKESAMAALTWLRMHAAELGIKHGTFDKHDLHVHIPEGAIPKDGPSAGITMVTAMASAATGRLVRHDTAMTGEVTLHGDVLPIGGLNEKAMAALRAGIQSVVIPEANLRDLGEMHESIKSKLEFLPVSRMEQVLERMLLPAKGRGTPATPAAETVKPVAKPKAKATARPPAKPDRKKPGRKA
ncbi:MAG: endopeptidase La [Candidatus Delongbacteria bacterium]